MIKRSTKRKESAATEPKEAVKFEPLIAALEGWFDKPLSELPSVERELLKRADTLFSLWDSLNPWQRRVNSLTITATAAAT